MAYPLAHFKTAWIAANRKPLPLLVHSLATATVGSAQPCRVTMAPRRQSSMSCLRSASSPVSFQGILEVLLIRLQGCVGHRLRSYRCRKRGFPAARSVAHPWSQSTLHAGQAARCQAAVVGLAPILSA